MRNISPKDTILSKHFRLSDLMGCHSVYTRGYINDPDTFTGTNLEEATTLCETLLEPIMERFGPISVSYGYISPELSNKIVKYQDPSKPSYHRYDAGAAVDILVHDEHHHGIPPVITAHEIDRLFNYSRMITYSESPFICVATRAEEVQSGKPRKAFYENRFLGKHGEKPKFVTKSKTEAGRARELEALLLGTDLEHWRGAGYSTYHGGGLRQMQDRRISRYSVLTDFLYNETAIREGIPNAPTMTASNRRVFEKAGAVYDTLLKITGAHRLSILEGYISPRLAAYLEVESPWGADSFAFVTAAPQGFGDGNYGGLLQQVRIDHGVKIMYVGGCLHIRREG